MDEVKLRILAILEENAYHKVSLEDIQKKIPDVVLYRHLSYLEQKRLIKLY
jgi:hypothetical protein